MALLRIICFLCASESEVIMPLEGNRKAVLWITLAPSGRMTVVLCLYYADFQEDTFLADS